MFIRKVLCGLNIFVRFTVCSCVYPKIWVRFVSKREKLGPVCIYIYKGGSGLCQNEKSWVRFVYTREKLGPVCIFTRKVGSGLKLCWLCFEIRRKVGSGLHNFVRFEFNE